MKVCAKPSSAGCSPKFLSTNCGQVSKASVFIGRVCGRWWCWDIMRSGGSSFALRMKILRSTHTVNPARGGPIESIRQSSAALLRRGHEVEIISLDAPKDPWVREAAVPVHALGPGLGGYGYYSSFSHWIRGGGERYDRA